MKLVIMSSKSHTPCSLDARWAPSLARLRALSVRQPWAWLIVNGTLKTVHVGLVTEGRCLYTPVRASVVTPRTLNGSDENMEFLSHWKWIAEESSES